MRPKRETETIFETGVGTPKIIRKVPITEKSSGEKSHSFGNTLECKKNNWKNQEGNKIPPPPLNGKYHQFDMFLEPLPDLCTFVGMI